MRRTTLLLGALLSLAIGCGDPKGSAGAIGAPVQNMDPSKMNKSAKDQKEWKLAPADTRAVKLNPDAPIEQKGDTDPKLQKVTPTAPVEQKIP